MNIFYFLYLIGLVAISIFSYGFIDLNLHLSANPLFIRLQAPLSYVVFHNRPLAAGIFFVILFVLFTGYYWLLKKSDIYFPTWNIFLKKMVVICLLLVVSFPALTYDLFNYMTTAKVTFTYKENPYLVMPIEIPNEPYLAFTRAANKVALYGPVWIFITALPHILGGGSIWQTFIMFKLINAITLLGFCYLIYRITGSMKNVVFFAFNPLVLMEILVSGHNDLYMMILAILGLYFWGKRGYRNKILGFVSLTASWFVKGATLVLLPLFFSKKYTFESVLIKAYWLMLAVFFIVAPLREELYPWYAIWMLSLAALLPFEKHTRLRTFTIVLSFALELRHIPYIYMGYYGGPGPLLRVCLTVTPILGYLVWSISTGRIRLWQIKKR